MRVDEFISRLEHVSKQSDGQYTALCPAHEDRHPSLSVGEGDDRRLLLKCHAGCSSEEIVAAMGLTMLDLFAEQSGKQKSSLSTTKKEPEKTPRHRRRSALKASDRGSTWTGNKRSGAIVPYGLWKLKSAAAAQYLIIVEGESDCWTLWVHGFPALGIPGAQMTKTLTLAAPHMDAIKNILIVSEPDGAGAMFPENVHRVLRDAGWKGTAYTLPFTPDAKDPNALHQSLGGDQERFRKALVDRMQQAKPRAAPRPVIEVGNQQLDEMTEHALAALHDANDPPQLFVRSGGLCRVCRDENARALLEVVNRAKLRNRLAQVGTFLIIGEKSSRSVLPPDKLVENILAEGKWAFPPLMSVNAAPILRPDGTVTATPGYDKPTRTFYAPTPGLHIPEIPDHPSDEECQEALRLLLDLFHDFPFADQASRANALALLFSVLMRPAINGNVPLCLVEAPVQGTGKTLLVTAISLLATGGISMQTAPAKHDDDEWRKRITATLLQAPQLVLVDNLQESIPLDSPSLAAVLTTSEWNDRRLGKNETVRVPALTIWVATGNNIRVKGDIPRRCYTIRMDANAEKPWERSGFRHDDLEGYIKARRGVLLAAAFTVIRAWYARGCPAAPASRAFGSFQPWANAVGGVLATAGVRGFLENLDGVRSVQDNDTVQWEAFFALWWMKFGGEPVTSDLLCRRILTEDMLGEDGLPDELQFAQERGLGSLKRSLGKHLSRLDGRVFDRRKLTPAGQDRIRKVRRWKLVPMAPDDSPEVTGAFFDAVEDLPACLREEVSGGSENTEETQSECLPPQDDENAEVTEVSKGFHSTPTRRENDVSYNNMKHVFSYSKGCAAIPSKPSNLHAAESADLVDENDPLVKSLEQEDIPWLKD